MAQPFSPLANTVVRVGLVLLPLGLAGIAVLLYAHARSDGTWHVNEPAPQPIPFRHDLHTGTLGMACAYCHTSADRAAHAGMPSARTCLTCHAQLWVGASVLQPLRTSLDLGQPVEWTSVHRLPDYVYFNHVAHVSKGVSCATCHGDMTQMPKTVRVNTLSMGWCLDCHREPQRYLDPRDAAGVAGLAGPDAARKAAAGVGVASAGLPKLYQDGDVQGLYDAARQHLTSCNTCHR